MDPDAPRRILEACFEPHGDGYVYYEHDRAPGIPVSVAEREQYLNNWTVFSPVAFRRRIAGRTPVTPPRGDRGRHALEAALRRPLYAMMLSGAPIALGLAWTVENPWLRYALVALAAVFVALAAWLFVQRRRRG